MINGVRSLFTSLDYLFSTAAAVEMQNSDTREGREKTRHTARDGFPLLCVPRRRCREEKMLLDNNHLYFVTGNTHTHVVPEKSEWYETTG